MSHGQIQEPASVQSRLYQTLEGYENRASMDETSQIIQSLFLHGPTGATCFLTLSVLFLVEEEWCPGCLTWPPSAMRVRHGQGQESGTLLPARTITQHLSDLSEPWETLVFFISSPGD